MVMQLHYHLIPQLILQKQAMVAKLEAESKLTDRYQTTVPEIIRNALRLSKRDKIRYSIRPDGEVVLTRATKSEGDDPVLGRFLSFLANDIANNPQRLQAVDVRLMQRIQSLVGDTEVNLDAALLADNE